MTVFAAADGSLLGETHVVIPQNIVVTEPTGTTASAVAGDAATGSNFNIQLDFSGGGLTASQQAIFATAAIRWESVITGDLPDVGSIDDVKIYASGKAIDGVGMILGQAGYTALRSGTQLPYQGTMSFDSADLASMESNGSLLDVITHEMGHVLGAGTLWSRKSLILGAGTTSSRFVGANALAEYKRFTGDAAATSVPVETDGGAGTADAHWDDATFGRELMTGYLSGGANPLSRMTAASLIDMGYPLVNVDAADLFTLNNALPIVGSLSAGTAFLGSPIALTLSDASDVDGVGSISFYRETNGIPGLQATGTVASDTLIVTNAGLGLAAQAATTGMSAGTYTFYARAADTRGALSAVATTTATLTNALPTPTPSAPTLSPGSDTGDSNSDRVTANNRPTIVGSAAALATVKLYVDGALAGSTVADASGQYSLTPTTALADGSRSVTVTATTAGGTSAASQPLTITIDTLGGTIASIAYDREWTQRITVTVNDPAVASRFVASTVALQNQTTGSSIAMNVLSVNGGTVTLAAVTPLSNGRYTLVVPTDAARDAAGNALTAAGTFGFDHLSGDANGDGAVNFDDLLSLARSYGGVGLPTSGGNVDYSSDGAVNFDDLLVLARQYGMSIDAAGALQSSSAAIPMSVIQSGGDPATTSFSSRVLDDSTPTAGRQRRAIHRGTFRG